jgi:hypothetical protein
MRSRREGHVLQADVATLVADHPPRRRPQLLDGNNRLWHALDAAGVGHADRFELALCLEIREARAEAEDHAALCQLVHGRDALGEEQLLP